MSDKRLVVRQFRDRLAQVIERAGDTHSAFARRIELDRSTLSQLLSADNGRLPRAETLAAIARAGRVSVDWLLGLTQRQQVGADIIEAVLQIERQAQSPVDDRLQRWFGEATGYKIRTVPMSFPDMLKLDEVIRFEYGDQTGEHTVELAHSRLDYMRQPDTELEACAGLQTITSFARGEAQWAGLPARVRRAQLDHMLRLYDELYPGFRLFLYDLRQVYSAPFTVFGPLRAVVYLGHMFFVFNSSEHIRVLSRRFDDLVRAATVQPSDVPAFLTEQRIAVR